MPRDCRMKISSFSSSYVTLSVLLETIHPGPVNSCDPPVSPFDNGLSFWHWPFFGFFFHSGQQCCTSVHAQHRSLTFHTPLPFPTRSRLPSPQAISNSDDDNSGDTLPMGSKIITPFTGPLTPTAIEAWLGQCQLLLVYFTFYFILLRINILSLSCVFLDQA